MPFENILEDDRPKRVFLDGKVSKPPSKTKLSAKEVGCEFCPLNTVPGIHKIMGEVHGRDIFIWGMAPGPDENREGHEFLGKSGKLLWQELKRVGITRGMCDIQNVVRCYPADRDEDTYPALKMRNPTPKEIHCCSIYTKRALTRQKAKVHLVFGEIAAKTLLGSEFKKGKKSFWSDKLGAHVLCIWHPSYLVRMGYYAGGTQPPNDKFKQWRSDLELAATLLGRKDRYEYVKGMQYIGITTEAQAREAYRRIKRAAKKGWRSVVDLEDGVLKSGRHAVLCAGFCYRVGVSYVFCLDHRRGAEISDEARAFNWKVVRRLLSDPDVKKTLHHGSYDAEVQLRLMGVMMEGFDYDTTFGDYFSDPEAKAYGLTAITDRRFPEFAGYKQIVTPECYTEEFLATLSKNTKMSPTKMYDMARKKNGLNYAQVPWPTLVIYNGADCDVTKRVEISTRERSNSALMHVYIDASYLTARMEKDGPLMDYKHHARVTQLYDVRVPRLEKQIKSIADNPKFSPGSPKQVANLLYNQLGLDMPGEEGEKENTRAETLELMVGQHSVVQKILDYRRAKKLSSTYLVAFKRSADLHDQKVTTKWWLTGAATGRMSSGAGREKKEDAESSMGIVNLQNIVMDVQLQNLLISDERWRDVYKHWKANGPFTEDTWQQFGDVDVFLGFDQGQFEMRVVAQRCGDRNLIGHFERDEDIHAEVGHSLMGLPKEVLMEESPERVAVKGMHFGLVYGLKAKGLWEHLRSEHLKRKMPFDKTVEWVQNLLDSYFAKYPKVAQMIEGDHRHAEKYGWVETMFKFRRPINVEEQKAAGSAWTGAYWANQSSNCVDFKTEALSQRGWLKWDEIKRGDVLLTKNAETGKLEWQSATDIRIFPDYSGKLYEFRSKSFSAVTTPQHRWLSRRDSRKGFNDVCVTSENLSDWGDDAIHRTGDYDGPSHSRYSDDWIRLVGWVVTDGGYTNKRAAATNMVSVYQTKDWYAKEIDDLFKRLGIPYTRNRATDPRVQKLWRISGRYGGWFKAVLPNRRLTYSFLSELPKRQLLILRDTMLKGDGSKGWGKSVLVSGKKKGIDVFQALCVLCGDASTIKWRDMSMYKPVSDKMQNVPVMAGCWTANILRRKFVRLTKEHKRVIVDARGVWCPVVPNTYFVARRNGSTYITGNTPIQGTAHQLLLIGLVPLIRQPKRYALLQRPKMEIHDAIYFIVKLKNLLQGAVLGQDMLENESLKIVREEFEIDWKVKLKAEPKAGFRFGNMVKNLGIAKGPKTISEFLNQFCEKAQKAQKALAEELGKLAN